MSARAAPPTITPRTQGSNATLGDAAERIAVVVGLAADALLAVLSLPKEVVVTEITPIEEVLSVSVTVSRNVNEDTGVVGVTIDVRVTVVEAALADSVVIVTLDTDSAVVVEFAAVAVVVVGTAVVLGQPRKSVEHVHFAGAVEQSCAGKCDRAFPRKPIVSPGRSSREGCKRKTISEKTCCTILPHQKRTALKAIIGIMPVSLFSCKLLQSITVRQAMTGQQPPPTHKTSKFKLPSSLGIAPVSRFLPRPLNDKFVGGESNIDRAEVQVGKRCQLADLARNRARVQIVFKLSARRTIEDIGD
jgi:hypothetical protein